METTVYGDIIEFHRKFFYLPDETRPEKLTPQRMIERGNCMDEEVGEYFEALKYGSMASIVDALVDVAYFALGTLVLMGIDEATFNRIWADVQRANMSKVRGKTHRGHDIDVMKPDGWVAPDATPFLVAAGYRGDD